MTAESFYRDMTAFMHREPFQPFIVEFLDGRRVTIERPKSVAIRGGVATYIAPGPRPVPIDCGDVRQIVDTLAASHAP